MWALIYCLLVVFSKYVKEFFSWKHSGLVSAISLFSFFRPAIFLTSLLNWIVVPFRHGERIGFSYLVSQKYTGDSAVVKVLRNSEVHEFNIKLSTHKRLIPAHINGRPPSYYIIAGFVFTAVTAPYLRSEVRGTGDLSLPPDLRSMAF